MIEITKIDDKNITVTANGKTRTRPAVFVAEQAVNGGVEITSNAKWIGNITANPLPCSQITVNGTVYATDEECVQALNQFIGLGFNKGGGNPTTPTESEMRKKYKWAIDIFEKDNSPNKRMILILSDSLPTFVFNAAQLGASGCTWRTSDGATYNANTTHTWDKTKDIPNPNGSGFVRWVIVDSANANIACNVANATNSYSLLAYFGNNAVATNLVFGSTTALNCSRLVEAILYDETATAASNAIGTSAFYQCYSLREITIPNTITSIGQTAFTTCVSLREITMPNSIITIGNNAFTYFHGLLFLAIENGWVVPSIDLSASTFFPESAAREFFNRLGNGTTTLTFGATLLNRWSAETKAIATNKGYTLA